MSPLFFILILTPFVSAQGITATGGFQGVDQWFVDALEQLSLSFSSLREDVEMIPGYASSILGLPYYGYSVYSFTKVTVTSGISKIPGISVINCGGGYFLSTPYSVFVVPEEGSCTPGCDTSKTTCDDMQKYFDHNPTLVTITADTLKGGLTFGLEVASGNPIVFYATNDYFITINNAYTAPAFQNMRS